MELGEPVKVDSKLEQDMTRVLLSGWRLRDMRREPVKVESAIDRADEFVELRASRSPNLRLWLWLGRFRDQTPAWHRAFNGRVHWQLFCNGKDR